MLFWSAGDLKHQSLMAAIDYRRKGAVADQVHVILQVDAVFIVSACRHVNGAVIDNQRYALFNMLHGTGAA